MKKLVLVVALMLIGGIANAEGVKFETSGGVGAIVSDNEAVGVSPIGKVDAQFNIGKYLSLGAAISQTGTFEQKQVPQEIVYANASPQAFAGKEYHPHHDDVIIVEHYNTDITVNITEAPPILPKRPADRTEQSFWMAEPFIQLGFPINVFHLIGGEFAVIRPYAKAFLGASGVKTQSSTSDIGVSKGLGCGVDLSFGAFFVGVEATRRHIDTGVASYGNSCYMGKARLLF